MNEMPIKTDEELLAPPHIDLSSLGLLSLGNFVTAFLGSIFVFVGAFFFLRNGLNEHSSNVSSSIIFSLLGFFWLSLTSLLNLFFERLIFPDKFRSMLPILKQTILFSILFYICITPLYIYVGYWRYDLLVYVFLIHTLINALGTSIITEITTHFRHVLLPIHGSFLGFFISVVILFPFIIAGDINKSTMGVFIFSGGGLILINTLISTLRGLFTFLYRSYYNLTGNDELGDMFSQIEIDEYDALQAAKKRLSDFRNSSH